MSLGLALLLAAAALVVVACWIAVGPGPKHEEGFLALYFGYIVLALGLAASVARPRPVVWAVYFPGVWWIGCTVTVFQVNLKYGYPLSRLSGLVPALGTAFAAGLLLCAVNVLLDLAVRSVLAMARLVSRGR